VLTTEQKQTLLRIAREAVAAAAKGRPYVPSCEDAVLRRPAAVFVTLHKGGELRGCIGMVEPVAPRDEAVADMARAAACDDYRFDPVKPQEVDGLRLEVSVLTPAEPVQDLAEIEVGVHGLIVEQGARRGLLLPQVAPEWGWDREEFLRHTCLKAGLPGDAWRKGAKILCFSAEVFGEETETSE
jgi:AmmeMemoRadiSam system protein A